MNSLKSKLALLINLALAKFPRRLPVGVSEFHRFADRVLSMSGKYADDNSMRFALASMIIYLKDQKDGTPIASVPDSYFLASLRKSAANQVASAILTEMKNKQAEETARRKELEATALEEAASNETVVS